MSAPRIRVTGGPWPERLYCHGQIAVPPAHRLGVYPVHGLGRNEVIVLLDRDPIPEPTSDLCRRSEDDRWWTCVYDRGDLTYQKPCPRGCEDGALNPDPGDDREDQLHPVTCVTCDGMGEVDA